MTATAKRKITQRPVKLRTTARRRLASAAVLRTSVRHIVLPGQVIAVTPSRRRETIAGFLRRTKWSRHSKRYGWQFRLPTICVVNGQPVLRKLWRTTRIRAGDHVEFWSRPMGGQGSTGKQVLGIVALVAVAALSLWTGGLAAAAWGPLAGSIVGGAIGCGGTLRVDVLSGRT